jgi:fructose-1,6-bisphosphatase/inositol monophosphatase family enzyme
MRIVLAEVRPGDGTFGGECGQAGDTWNCWIIDPVDGTRAFIAGGKVWGTQITLQVEGILTLGVTSAPALGRRWGERG